jgi:hypothetical protein
MEAQKLKRKLNGSILKGQKIRIEEAKPEKRKIRSEEAGESDHEEERQPKKVKKEKKSKAKAQDGVLPGVELPEGRKVKRGWTESAEEKKAKKQKDKSKDKQSKSEKDDKKKTRKASKYSREPELLFKTELPPNVAASADTPSKKESKKKKKSETKTSREVIVHEFEKREKVASFLKSEGAEMKKELEYVDGRGWVDENGEVVELEPDSAKRKREGNEKKKRKQTRKAKMHPVDTSPKLDDENSPAAQERLPSLSNENIQRIDQNGASESSSEPSSSDPSSVSDSSDDEEQEDATPPEQTPKEIHPLEALYKRPKHSTPSGLTSPAKPPPINTSFTFFANDDENGTDEEDNSGPSHPANPPLTPFTKKDLSVRGRRSPAPTPDTAAINRKFSFSGVKLPSHVENDEDEDEEMQEEEDETMDFDMPSSPLKPSKDRSAEDQEDEDESEFAKFFWEHRGEANKRWRTRRKDSMKLKRKRENRRLTRRAL